MFKIVMVSIFLALTSFTQPESTKEMKNNLVGVWEYNNSQLPYEFQSGTLTFSEVGKTIMVKVKAGYDSFESKEVNVEGNTVSFTLEVEYEAVEIKLEQEGKILKGYVMTDASRIPLELKKIK